MFFVVYSIHAEVYFTIPTIWVHDLTWDNHVNRSLNKNQMYRCYWTQNPAAWNNGTPNENFTPNFKVPIGNIFPAEENCFICYLAYYSGEKINLLMFPSLNQKKSSF